MSDVSVAPPVEAAAEVDPTRFDLPACADIRVAAEIRSHCLRALEGAGAVTIGCGEVDRIDVAALQCLGSLAIGLSQVDRHLELIDRTESFDRAVKLLGFEELLGSDRSDG